MEAALRNLDGDPLRVAATEWPAATAPVRLPGLYSWWIDHVGAADLSRGLGFNVDAGRIYAGQAGATKWPSGKQGPATLGSRIGSNHLGGRIRASTFRLTLASALATSLKLSVVGPKKLASESEQRLSSWMLAHLEVAVHPFEDRDVLADLESNVLDVLDPPLNLSGRASTPLRRNLSSLRTGIAKGPTSGNS